MRYYHLARTIVKIIMTFMDLLFHAVWPSGDDPYFGALPFGLRLINATAFWLTLVCVVHYFAFERDARNKRTGRRRIAPKDKRYLKRTDIGELVWRDIRVVPQNRYICPVEGRKEKIVSWILFVPRLVLQAFRIAFLCCRRCFCLAPRTRDNRQPGLPRQAMENIFFALSINNEAKLGAKTGKLGKSNTLKIKFKILDNKMTLTHIADKNITLSQYQAARIGPGQGRAYGKPVTSGQKQYEYHKVKAGKEIYFDGEKLVYSDGKPVLSHH